MRMKMQIRRIAVWALLVCLLSGVAPVPAAAASFRDVPAASWAAPSIQRCVQQGWFQGESATTFGTGHPMTRAAFAVVLCRFFDWEMVTPQKGTYEDVQDPDAWYFSAVETAYANGAITRQTDTFRPADSITREEMAAMLVRALGYGTIAGLAQAVSAPFTDTTTNAGYIAMAYELGIVNGTSGTTFAPDRAATREQVAVILDRLDQKLSGTTLSQLGIVSSVEDAAALEDLDVVAVSAARFTYSGQTQVNVVMEEETLSRIRAAVEQSGATELLRVSYQHQRVSPYNRHQGDCRVALAGLVHNHHIEGRFGVSQALCRNASRCHKRENPQELFQIFFFGQVAMKGCHFCRWISLAVNDGLQFFIFRLAQTANILGRSVVEVF